MVKGDVEVVIELLKLHKRFRKKAVKFNKRAAEALREAQETCPHEDVEVEYHYNEGGYMDKASTTTLTTCKLCKKDLKTETKTHNYYS